MVEGSSGLLQVFYPQGVLNKILYANPCPEVQVLAFPHTIFDRKGIPFVY